MQEANVHDFVLPGQQNKDRAFPDTKEYTRLYHLILTHLEPDKLLLRNWSILKMPESDFDQAVEWGLLKSIYTCDRTYFFYDQMCWLPGRHAFTTEKDHTVTNEINRDGYPSDFDTQPNPLDLEVSVFPLKGFFLKDGKKKPAVGVFNKGEMVHRPLRKVITMIGSDLFKERTLQLRAISTDTKEGKLAARKAKECHFSYATFSGTFTYCNDNSLIRHSGLICIDLDGLEDPQAVRQAVQQQEGYVFSFVSPRGKGLKVIFIIDPGRYSQGQWYVGICHLLQVNCGVPAGNFDESCKNVSRACFLSYDPTVHVNPDLI